jgi:hypothetical protein
MDWLANTMRRAAGPPARQVAEQSPGQVATADTANAALDERRGRTRRSLKSPPGGHILNLGMVFPAECTVWKQPLGNWSDPCRVTTLGV